MEERRVGGIWRLTCEEWWCNLRKDAQRSGFVEEGHLSKTER